MKGREVFEETLERALTNLSAPAERQIDYLHGMRMTDIADELALELSDVVGRVDEAVLHKLLSPRTAESVKAVDQALSRMSGGANAHLWNKEALRSRPEWQAVRQLALEALENVKSDRHGQI
jgi:hypothetical protein